MLPWQLGVAFAVIVGAWIWGAKHVGTRSVPIDTPPPIPINVGDMILVNMKDPRIVRPPNTAFIDEHFGLEVIALSSPQGPNFIMAKQFATLGHPDEVIFSVPRDAVIRNLSAGGGISISF